MTIFGILKVVLYTAEIVIDDIEIIYIYFIYIHRLQINSILDFRNSFDKLMIYKYGFKSQYAHYSSETSIGLHQVVLLT